MNYRDIEELTRKLASELELEPSIVEVTDVKEVDVEGTRSLVFTLRLDDRVFDIVSSRDELEKDIAQTLMDYREEVGGYDGLGKSIWIWPRTELFAELTKTSELIPLSKVSYIRKVKNKYCVFSEKGRRMGCYDTLEKARKRLKQIEFFKHLAKTKK